jgi:hypothetical protein
MPCVSEPDYSGYQRKLDEVTQVVCGVLTQWERAGKPFKISSQATEWWKRHKAWDQKRRAEEKRQRAREDERRIALAKLSPAERRALGL